MSCRANSMITPILASFSVFLLAAISQAQETPVPVYGVHDIELGEDVDASEFEQFVVEKMAPIWKEPRNGMRMMVFKGDRGERKDKYQLVYAFESKETRDKFFPPETKQPSTLFRETMEPVADVMRGLSNFKMKRKSYTDYSPVGVYSPVKPGSTPAIAVRNIELAEDVDHEEFEKFIVEKFAPAFKKPREGMQFVFIKGDRGDRKGKFQFLWIFESVENRNAYFPEEGGNGTGKLGEVLEPLDELMQELREFKFTSDAYTDYYLLNQTMEVATDE